jgi:hypothetical protein
MLSLKFSYFNNYIILAVCHVKYLVIINPFSFVYVCG